jgi:hypothetical protein
MRSAPPLLAAAWLTISPLAGAQPPSAQAAAARVDHVVVGVADLDFAIAEVERATGVRPVPGGEHPGGTHNALLALGDGVYLELLALRPDVEAPQYSALRELARPTPIDWAVAADEVEALRRPLLAAGFQLSAPSPGSRTRPDGSMLAWETFGIDGDGVAGAPFFIVWAADAPHPASTSPAGCTLAGLRVVTPDLEPLERLRAALALDVELAAGETAALTVKLACPTGEIVY